MNKIKSFGDKVTAEVYKQQQSSKLPPSIQSVALRKLIMIDNAESINDLRVPPGNHFEKLQGHSSRYSIRINQQYRITMDVIDNWFENVKITDYH